MGDRDDKSPVSEEERPKKDRNKKRTHKPNVSRLQKDEREETLERAADVLANVTKEDIVAAVRKSRESRAFAYL
jgi:hypothetical protein